MKQRKILNNNFFCYVFVCCVFILNISCDQQSTIHGVYSTCNDESVMDPGCVYLILNEDSTFYYSSPYYSLGVDKSTLGIWTKSYDTLILDNNESQFEIKAYFDASLDKEKTIIKIGRIIEGEEVFLEHYPFDLKVNHQDSVYHSIDNGLVELYNISVDSILIGTVGCLQRWINLQNISSDNNIIEIACSGNFIYMDKEKWIIDGNSLKRHVEQNINKEAQFSLILNKRE